VLRRFVFEHKILASAARTTSGNSENVNVGDLLEGIVLVSVSAKAGTTPNLKIYIEVSNDLINWYPLAEFFAITDVGNYSLQIENFGRYIRERHDISGGSPSFTYECNFLGKG